MASFVYDSMVDDMAAGTIALGLDDLKVMLVTSAYVPDKAAHTRRSDITGEVDGLGYTAAGAPVTVTIDSTIDNQTDIELGGATWPASTISARGAVYYDSRGGPPENDELVAYIDFGGDVVSIGGLFTLEASMMTIQN